jgi:hypothetical protein
MRPGQDAREEIAALAVGRGWGLHEMRPVSRSLEDIYIEIISGKAAVAAMSGAEGVSGADGGTV